MRYMLFPFVFCVALGSVVQADEQAAMSCAATLPANSKMIYDAAAPHVQSGSNLRDIIIEHTRPMVENGSITKSEAEEAAPGAGKCLELMK